MALIYCPECGREVSDTCERCIHCGYKLSSNDGGAAWAKGEVIADRTEARETRTLAVLDFILTGALMPSGIILFINWFIISDFQNAKDWVQLICVSVHMILWVICIGGIAGGIVCLVKCNRNGHIQDDCIVYYEKEDELLLVTLENRKIAIKSSQFIKLFYGLSTDCLLVLRYRDER